jgi:hypothetical protein
MLPCRRGARSRSVEQRWPDASSASISATSAPAARWRRAPGRGAARPPARRCLVTSSRSALREGQIGSQPLGRPNEECRRLRRPSFGRAIEGKTSEVEHAFPGIAEAHARRHEDVTPGACATSSVTSGRACLARCSMLSSTTSIRASPQVLCDRADAVGRREAPRRRPPQPPTRTRRVAVADRGEVDEPGPCCEPRTHPRGDLDREPGLADAPRPHDREEPAGVVDQACRSARPPRDRGRRGGSVDAGSGRATRGRLALTDRDTIGIRSVAATLPVRIASTRRTVSILGRRPYSSASRRLNACRRPRAPPHVHLSEPTLPGGPASRPRPEDRHGGAPLRSRPPARSPVDSALRRPRGPPDERRPAPPRARTRATPRTPVHVPA